MSAAGLAALVAGTGVALFLVVVLIILARKHFARARAAVAEIAAGRQPVIQGRASSFGILSRGRTQARGLGYLALFDDELVFRQVMAKNHVRARRADLLRVTTPRSFLGKTTGRRLLA